MRQHSIQTRMGKIRPEKLRVAHLTAESDNLGKVVGKVQQPRQHYTTSKTGKVQPRQEPRQEQYVVRPVSTKIITPHLKLARFNLVSNLASSNLASRFNLARPRFNLAMGTAARGFLLRIVAFSVIVGMNLASLSGIGYTRGAYFDEENMAGNALVADLLDFVLLPSAFSPVSNAINLSPGTTTSKTIGMINAGGMPFQYTVRAANLSGDMAFCNDLKVDTELVSLSLSSAEPLPVYTDGPTTTIDTWGFDFGMGASNHQNSICNFDLVYDGWQKNSPSYGYGGYRDTEQATNTIASWGMRINKIYYDVDSGEEEPDPEQCDARSQGYWSNNEGCSGGTGTSPHVAGVNSLSSLLSGVFSTTTGAGICSQMNIPSCPSGNTVPAKRCRAKVHTLADELNVVTGRLDITAIIAGADDGSTAFDHLGLSSFSTVGQALAAAEAIIANASSTKAKLVDAAYVSERIYSFYEDENPSAPLCLYDESLPDGKGVEGENEWVEVYNQTNVATDITSWKICDNTSCDAVPASNIIPAAGYGVITGSSTTWAFWDMDPAIVKIVLPDGKIGNGLGNDADMLMLERPDGVIVDQMNYGIPDTGWANYNSDIWTPGSPDAAEGNALARVPSGYDTNQPSDFVELTPPSVDLISPDESDNSQTWVWGDMHTITWAANNPNGNDADLDIALYYIKDVTQDGIVNAGDTRHLIVADTENDGAYDWVVPSGFIGYIWIEVVATAPENPMLTDRARSGRIYDPMPLRLWNSNPQAVLDAIIADPFEEGEEIGFLEEETTTPQTEEVAGGGGGGSEGGESFAAASPTETNEATSTPEVISDEISTSTVESSLESADSTEEVGTGGGTEETPETAATSGEEAARIDTATSDDTQEITPEDATGSSTVDDSSASAEVTETEDKNGTAATSEEDTVSEDETQPGETADSLAASSSPEEITETLDADAGEDASNSDVIADAELVESAGAAVESSEEEVVEEELISVAETEDTVIEEASTSTPVAPEETGTETATKPEDVPTEQTPTEPIS